MPQVRFGKHPAKSDYRTLRLENFLLSNLADPPQTFDTLPRVFTGTGIEDVPTLFPMDGNNQYGDCTIAALAHAITVFCGYQGKTNIPDEAMVVKLYLKLTNGVDSGLQELDVLNYWQSNEVDGDKISAYVRIAASNLKHVKQAIQLFGGVYLGFQVQENCVDEFNAGVPWTPGPLTNDGHAVYAVGYDDEGVTVLTWGSTQKATWDWWNECVDEAYAVLSAEALEPGFAPGFDSAALANALKAVAN
jgi:hypothetical protein